MRAFHFDLQRFDAEYEFTSGIKKFTNSNAAYYHSGQFTGTNYDALNIGYNINWYTGEDKVEIYIKILFAELT